MSLEPYSIKRSARIQRRPDGGMLGVCVVIPAEVIMPFVSDDTDEIEFDLILMPTGVHIEIGGDAP